MKIVLNTSFFNKVKIILIILLCPLLSLGQKYTFTEIAGPILVEPGTPVTLSINDVMNNENVPCENYGLVKIYANIPLYTSTVPYTIKLSYPGGQLIQTRSAIAETILAFDFMLSPTYDPCVDGEFFIQLNQNGTGFNLELFRIEVTIEVISEGCNDVAATNYDPNANVDDGSCVYPPPPPNNDCLSAIPLTINANNCDGSYTNGTDIGATPLWGGNGTCFDTNGSIVQGDVWFSVVVADPSADLIISTDFEGGTHTDTEVEVLRGTCNQFFESLGCGQDIDDNNWLSKVIIPSSQLVAGETLFIMVDRYNDFTPPGTFCIEVYNTGCMDPNAFNYQPLAIEDNGSCLYTPLAISNGDVYLENTSASGIILKSPDSNCWRTTVDNNGNLTTVAVPCP